MPRTRWRYWWVLTIVALVASTQPVLAGFGTEIEESVGDWMARAFIAQRGHLDQPPVQAWVARIGEELLKHTTRPNLDYHFVVLDSPEANGFALPGGWVFITAGLLESMESEDELAAVMAHELGHLANRDFQRVLLRTALWFGLAEVLRHNDRRDLAPMVQVAQLVETLNHSRRRESGADAFGARLTWDAGYDPRAMAAFLGDEPQWSYLQTIFSTHPHPTERSDRLRERFLQLRTEDPRGALALAHSLLDRGRCSAAGDVLAEPLAGVSEVERMALLERVDDRARVAARTDGATLPREHLSNVCSAMAAAEQAWADSEEARRVAWTRLRRLWKNHQVERALVVAQAVDPEINDPAYLLLVAQTVNVLHQAMRGANLIARTLRIQQEVSDGLALISGRIQTTRVEPVCEPALQVQADAIAENALTATDIGSSEAQELARLAEKYHQIARLAAPLLVELALSGEGDPAERLTFARFMLMEVQVKQLDDRLARLDGALDRVAENAWGKSVELYRLRLNLEALGGTRRAREAIFAALERRMSAEPGVFQRAWAAGVMPGDRALELLRETMRPGRHVFSDGLRATQILMRIAFLEVNEQVAWCEKENEALEGAD